MAVRRSDGVATVRYGMEWYGTVWNGMVSCSLVWCSIDYMVWHSNGTVHGVLVCYDFGMMWFLWYCMVRYDTVYGTKRYGGIFI